MADSGIGFERSIDATGYSSLASGAGDHGFADRPQRPGTSGVGRDGSAQDLASLIKLGTLKMDAGNEAEATQFFRKALELGDRSLGPDHPDLILLLNDLTRLYLKQSAHAAAEPLLLRLLDMKRSKGEDHPEVATVLASLASVRQSLGRHESAEQLWRRVLDIREHTLAPNHFAIATALEHLGDACAARGNIAEALSAFQRAQTIRERTLGSAHSSLRTSRERIADLQLQASDNSLEPPTELPTVSTPERYRLLSGEQLALSASTTLGSPREKSAAVPTPNLPISRQTRVKIQHGFADAPPILDDDAPMKEEVAVPLPLAPALDLSAVPFHDEGAVPFREALESLREELERPYDSPSFAERSAAIFESVISFLGKREVIAGVVVVVISLLSLALATGAHAWGEVDQAAGIGAPPARDPVPANIGQTNSAGQLPAAKRESASVPGTAAANTASKVVPSRPRVVEEKNPPKKAAETKTESKKLSIPTLSNGVMSRLDSVAATAAAPGSRLGDPLAMQPSTTGFGAQRSSFDYPEQSSGPQRARLIGELPTPRVPDQVADVEGEVRVRFNVDTDGAPVMSTFAVVNSPNPLLTAAVRKVIPAMRFEPARTGGSDGKPIVDVVQIGFQFSRVRR